MYLPAYCEPELKKTFRAFPNFRFQIFSRQTSQPAVDRNMHFFPVDSQLFNKSLIHCSGIITGGGFETPAEALHLGKKIITIPIRAQYEQQCNAAALQQMGILHLKTIDDSFAEHFHEWINKPAFHRQDYSNSVPQALAYLFSGKMETEEYFDLEDYDILN